MLISVGGCFAHCCIFNGTTSSPPSTAGCPDWVGDGALSICHNEWCFLALFLGIGEFFINPPYHGMAQLRAVNNLPGNNTS